MAEDLCDTPLVCFHAADTALGNCCPTGSTGCDCNACCDLDGRGPRWRWGCDKTGEEREDAYGLWLWGCTCGPCVWMALVPLSLLLDPLRLTLLGIGRCVLCTAGGITGCIEDCWDSHLATVQVAAEARQVLHTTAVAAAAANSLAHREMLEQAMRYVTAGDLVKFVTFLGDQQDCELDFLVNGLNTKTGLSNLHLAVKGGFEDITQALCYMPVVKVNTRTPGGLTAICFALESERVGIAQVLMAQGAGVDVMDAAKEPLIVRMARLNKGAAIRFLISETTALDVQDAQGWTALHHLASGGHVDLVTLLLQAGAEPNVNNVQGLTPLYLACLGDKKLGVAAALFKYGADPNIQDRKGLTILHHAAMKDQSLVLELFLKNGANPETENKLGLTPFHVTMNPVSKELLSRVMPAGVLLKRPLQQDMQRAGKLPTRRKVPFVQTSVGTVPPVFISFRVRESGAEAKLLGYELAANGFGAYVCTEALKNADDWATVISHNLDGCKMMVVLATSTYGAKGTEIMGTFEELNYAMRHDIPMFIVKMCPQLKEARARMLLEPRQVEMVMWAPGAPVPDSITAGILAKLAEITAAEKS